jgi:hypothetical protein
MSYSCRSINRSRRTMESKPSAAPPAGQAPSTDPSSSCNYSADTRNISCMKKELAQSVSSPVAVSHARGADHGERQPGAKVRPPPWLPYPPAAPPAPRQPRPGPAGMSGIARSPHDAATHCAGPSSSVLVGIAGHQTCAS